MRSSGIADIVRSALEFHQLPEAVRVQGATSSAQALVVARYVYEASRKVIVLCPDDDVGAELSADLECLSGVFNQPLQVWHFPTWEQSPYSPIAPSIRTRLARLSALASLAQAGAQAADPSAAPIVIVTSLAAAAQATIPRRVLQEQSLRLQAGQSVESRETLVSRLLEAGYLRVETVEDPGTFAVRGDIIDIFAPQMDMPVRLELFGDEVEKFRAFDPASQRTLAAAEKGSELFIPPAREVLINRETTPLLRERLKSRADDLAIHRSVRDPILASIQGGAYPDHSDAWAPFAYPEIESLWDHMGEQIPVVWVDELSCQQEWDEFKSEQERLAEECGKNGLVLPPIGDLFGWTPALEKRVKDQSRLYLDRIELANLESIEAEAEADQSGGEAVEARLSARQKVFIRPNSDLLAASKQSLGDLEPKFRLWKKQGFQVYALAATQGQLERIRFLLEERGLSCRIASENPAPPEPAVIQLGLGTLSGGFRWPAEGLVILTEDEILGTRHSHKQRKPGKTAKTASAAKDWSGVQALADLSVGDHVVHVDHGIGRYQGLVRLDLSGAPSDFLLLEYAGKDKLYLPVYRLNAVQKYAGVGESIALDKLGSQQFAKTKEKVRDAVRKLAVDLVQLYAERKVRPGIRMSPPDGLFREFEAKFPFDETVDQAKAIDAVADDFASGRMMDRLICGDVGYGKTEVAMRAAFLAVSSGKQVVVLVPTTVLAFQHEQSFKTRFKDYPISVESISRFKSAKEQRTVLDSLASGKLDIIIGTHRLLSRDVKFRDLGLVIVDEEHRFGVEHKEKLKALKINTHVLTLTATPIPRTLHMALSGLREISLINTAPVDRLPIRTYVSKFDESLIQRAIQFELSRGGQVFFLHNRVQTIQEVTKKIAELVPEARIGVGHGQMAEGELEKTMLDFYQKRTNVLVCTTIIESGLDVPSANTILINRADALGLAQLYQIRGRVGRGQQRAYAYLLIPAEGAVTGDAKRRLEVIQRFVELGSGFSIASHDLEIRGGGDLLGPQQSGHIAAVGFDLYTELLEEAIRTLEGKPLEDAESAHREPEIKAPFPAFLSEEYVPDIHQRLSLYRRFSAAATEAEIERLEEELRDRFGPPPMEAHNLLWLIRVKQLLKRAGLDSLTVGPEKVSLVSGPGSRLDPVRTIALISAHPGRYQLTPDSKLVAKVPTGTLRDLYFGLEGLLGEFGAPR